MTSTPNPTPKRYVVRDLLAAQDLNLISRSDRRRRERYIVWDTVDERIMSDPTSTKRAAQMDVELVEQQQRELERDNPDDQPLGATMTSTQHLYSLSLRHPGAESYAAVAVGVTLDQLIARITHEGVERKTAAEWARAAALAVHHEPTTTGAVSGDRFEYANAGPRGESFRVRCTAVVIEDA